MLSKLIFINKNMHRKAFWAKLIYKCKPCNILNIFNQPRAEFILRGKDTVPGFDDQQMAGYFHDSIFIKPKYEWLIYLPWREMDE